MRKGYFFGCSLLLIIFCFSCNSKIPANSNLFTEAGRNWFVSGASDWSYEGDELIGKIKCGSGFLMTERRFGNFVLELEFKPDSTINSGVFVRCKNMALSAEDCYELNIWDLHPNQDARTGAVVGRTKPLAHVNTLNKWNIYRIVCENDSIRAWINGLKVIEIADKSLKEGYIALQAAERGTIRFRDVRLKELTRK